MIRFESMQLHMQAALLQDRNPEASLLTVRGARQFHVYRNAYGARLRAALRDNYEVLYRVLGDDEFEALASTYIAAKPSHHYSLRWFGHDLANFMAEEFDAPLHPAAVDLARLEWALRCAFDATDAPVLERAALAAIDASHWPGLCFTVHASVQRLMLQWAVGPVWSALQGGDSEAAAPVAMEHAVLVWRQGLQPQWASLEPQDTAFLQALQAGHSFAGVCDALAQCVGEDHAAATAATLLGKWLDAGVISAVQLPPCPALAFPIDEHNPHKGN